MNSLVERLSDHAREQGSVTATRDRSAAEWRFLSWAELSGEVNRLAGALEERCPRGQIYGWSAPPGTRRLALDLALLHLGAVGALAGSAAGAESGGDAWTDAEYSDILGSREQAGRLVRLIAELRPGDAAAVRGGRSLSQAQVLALAERVGKNVGLVSPEPVLVSAGAAAEQAVAWGAVHAGYGVATGGADLLPSVRPMVWVATPDQLRALPLVRSRAGALGRLTRTLGNVDAVLGARLTRVFVDGAMPAEAEVLRDRGIEVVPWVE